MADQTCGNNEEPGEDSGKMAATVGFGSHPFPPRVVAPPAFETPSLT